ncbi:MAG: Bro-N domain-containing protein [Clostridia bacterium]
MENELKNNKDIALFENKKIRKEVHNNEWYFSVVDIIEILTESKIPKRYWTDLKKKFENEGNFETYDKIVQLKLIAEDGKKRLTDCANRETIFRLIQSIPSPNAEPFKLWFAKLAEERIQEINNPSLILERAKNTYFKKGYSQEWTNARLKSSSARNQITDEWKKRGAETNDYSILTDEISKGTFGISTKIHKQIKKLEKSSQNLRDNMSPIELALITLAEVTTTEIHKSNDSQGLPELKKDAKDGGEIASITRKNIEQKLGKSIVTSENSLNFKNNSKHLNDK